MEDKLGRVNERVDALQVRVANLLVKSDNWRLSM